MRVLIAEDDPVTRLTLKRLANKAGHDARTAEDGEQAWELFCQQPPDVVISDLLMPKLDGLELVQRVRSRRDLPYSYFILLSGVTDTKSVHRGMELGADDYLKKPLNPEELQVRLLVAARISVLQRQIVAQKAELERLTEELSERGQRDPLTRMSSRLRLREDLEVLRIRATRQGQRSAVALLAIDDFQHYCELNGVMAGDDVLRRVGAMITAHCARGDQTYRYEGDTFVIVSQEPREKMLGMAERLCRAVQALEIQRAGAGPGRAAVSVGIAHLDAGKTVESVLGDARRALEQAQTGRSRVVSIG